MSDFDLVVFHRSTRIVHSRPVMRATEEECQSALKSPSFQLKPEYLAQVAPHNTYRTGDEDQP
jgi:hypothetical protein